MLFRSGDRPTLGVMDLSFISLTKVLPTLWKLLVQEKEVVLLVKPQFEVGREQVGKKGVVRDPKAQAQAIQKIIDCVKELGWQVHGLTWSPITGPAGNIEFLLWLQNVPTDFELTEQDVSELTQSAIASLR